MYSFITLLLLPVAALAQSTTMNSAVTTGVTPSQSTAIRNDLRSYGSSLTSAPTVTALAFQLIGQVSDLTAQIESLNPIPTGNDIDWRSFATNPPSLTSYPAWYSTIGTNVQSSVGSFRTSVLNDAVRIVRSDLGYSSTLNVATLAPTTGVGAASSATPGSMGTSQVPSGLGTLLAVSACAVGFAALLL